jgi:hypothetical protein
LESIDKIERIRKNNIDEFNREYRLKFKEKASEKGLQNKVKERIVMKMLTNTFQGRGKEGWWGRWRLGKWVLREFWGVFGSFMSFWKNFKKCSKIFLDICNRA